MVEEIVVHEVAVALIVGGLQADILIQIDGMDLGEIQALFGAAARQLPVHADGAGAGGEAEGALRVLPDDGFDDVSGDGAGLFVIFCDDHTHGWHFPFQ